MTDCPCGSGRDLQACCGPYLAAERWPETAEALMRSRYSAYVEGAIAYLGKTLHPQSRADYDEAATRRWAENAAWLGLEVRSTQNGGPDAEEGVVEFIAAFKEDGVVRRHHELARFTRGDDGRWYYADGQTPKPETVRHAQKVGRNDPCPCGSGKKYKKCCGR